MSKYFVVHVRVLSQDSSQVKVGDYQSNYKGDDDYLDSTIPDTLRDYYNTSNFKSDLLSPINDNSDEKQISVELTFDYDKLNSNVVGDFSIFADLLKKKVEDVFKISFTKKEKIPSKVDYELIKSETNNVVNTFTTTQNGGGWEIIYRIKAIQQPTQTATQSTPQSTNGVTQSQAVVAPTQSVPTVTDPNQPIAQESSKEEVYGSNDGTSNSKNPDGKFPGISKVFDPTIKLDPIKMEMPSNEADRQEFAKGLGYLPFVWYNGYQINYSDIKYFALYHDGIIPKCKIIFFDTFNFMKSVGFPLDDTKMQVFINSKSKNLKSIHLEFKVQNFQDNGNNSYTIIGTINIPELYLKKYKSYNKKTSVDVIKDVCKEMSIGFNSNIDNSDDAMTGLS